MVGLEEAERMSSPYDLYRGTTSRKELDLRAELRRTLYGASDEIAKGKVGLLRKMREDSNGDLVKCPCRNQATTEPDRDFYCRYCHSMGYFWDEYKIVYYKNNVPFKKVPGEVQDFESNMFYFEYNAVIKPTDFIVEVELDNEGRPVLPVNRLRFYDIISADKLRADNGRAEFWQIRAKEQRDWSVWYAVKNRQHN
jgi:hypothetical protein